MKPLYSVKHLVDAVVKEINLPEHTDYVSAGSDASFLYDDTFFVRGMVDYGGSEGIYLDLEIFGSYGPNGEEMKEKFATIKTLDDSDMAYRDFCRLNADFVLQVKQYRNEHRDDFIRRGYRYQLPDSKGMRYCYDRAEAIAYAKEGALVYDCYKQEYLSPVKKVDGMQGRG